MKKMIAIVLALMLCVSALSVVAFAAEGDITVYAKVPEGWTDVGAYTWDPEDFGTWPGSKMTLNADGWYEITMPGTHTTVIINSAGPQTVNIDIEAGKDVWITVLDEQEGGKNKATVSYDGGQTSETPEAPEAPADVIYTVAGTAGICGENTEWNPSAEANQMTKGEDGIWTITYANVPAGEHKLKVTDGSWDNCWGAISGGDSDGNIVFTLEEATEVVVKFNPANGKVTVLVNGEDMNPATGDMNLAAISVAMLAATAGVVALVGKKKEF